MLNERIRKLRLAKGLTLQQVGDVFGISRGSVSSWESGVNTPDARKLVKLAEVLGTTVESLVTGSNFEISSEDFVSKVRFCEWNALGTPFAEATETTTAIHRPLGPNAFASRYPGHTKLHSPHSPVPPGAIIFVDPDKTPTVSNFVLFKSTSGNFCISSVSLKKEKKGLLYVEDSEFNAHEINSKDIHVLGVLTEWRISFAL